MFNSRKNTRSGFTLIEVLASFMVLSVILVLLAQVFSGASDSMEVGVDSSLQLSNGRAVLDYMARELSMATADDLLTMKADGDDIYFVALIDNVETTKRLANQIHYYTATETNGYTRTVLKRSAATSITTVDAYTDSTWWNSHIDVVNNPILVDNVENFTITLYDEAGNTATPYDSNCQNPPVYAEIYFELLSEKNALKADLLTAAAATDYRERMAKPFFRRVYFNNYLGSNRDI